MFFSLELTVNKYPLLLERGVACDRINFSTKYRFCFFYINGRNNYLSTRRKHLDRSKVLRVNFLTNFDNQKFVPFSIQKMILLFLCFENPFSFDSFCYLLHYLSKHCGEIWYTCSNYSLKKDFFFPPNF